MLDCKILYLVLIIENRTEKPHLKITYGHTKAYTHTHTPINITVAWDTTPCFWWICADIKGINCCPHCQCEILLPISSNYKALRPEVYCTGLFISSSGVSEIDCATTKTDTAERSISIGRESLQVFFCTRGLGVLPGSTARSSREENWRSQ